MPVNKNNVVLIGMPSCGKSTAGVLLAKRLAMGFLDTDLLIQSSENQSLQDIIDTKGVEYFLDLEQEQILSIDVENTVIATGGSAVYSDKAMQKLADCGKIVYIRLPMETISSRLTNFATRGIAIYPEQTLEQLYEHRSGLYEKYAQITIDAYGLDHNELIEAIIEML